MKSAPAKFTFDLDLSPKAMERAHEPVQDEEPKQILSDAALAMLIQNAREDGYRQGLAEGEQSAQAREAQNLVIAAQGLASQVQGLLKAVDANRAQSMAEAVGLAEMVGRKLATHLLAAQPEAEIRALIDECFTSLEGVPHLVIRCHPDLADKVREIATERMATSGFSGRLVVMGDPDQAVGDGRIEWVDGGLVRDIGAISAQIEKKIAHYLAAHGFASPEQTTSEQTETH